MKSLKTLVALLIVPSVMGHYCDKPRSCYVQTLTTKNIGTDCPPLTTCGLHPECFLMSTTTISAPATDPCCPTTATKIVPGPCPTCQVGCDVSTVTLFTTASGPIPTAGSYLQKDSVETTVLPTATPCTTTLLEHEPFTLGPTKTVFLSTVTKTATVDCGEGCGLVTKNIGGIGPVAIFTTTVTATVPVTTTTFTCRGYGV